MQSMYLFRLHPNFKTQGRFSLPVFIMSKSYYTCIFAIQNLSFFAIKKNDTANHPGVLCGGVMQIQI